MSVVEPRTKAAGNEDDILGGLREWFGPDAVCDDDAAQVANDMASELAAIDAAVVPPRSRSRSQERTAWRQFVADLPSAARLKLRDVHVPWIGFKIVVEYEKSKFGWMDGHRVRRTRGVVTGTQPVDRVERRRAWARLFAGHAASVNCADLGRTKDAVLRRQHAEDVVSGNRPDELPSALRNVQVVNGVLTINENGDRHQYPGVASFFEQTPPELAILDARAVRRRFDPRTWTGGRAWDLTAGVGTIAATLGPLGWRVVSTDLTNFADDVKFLDARNLGLSPYHRMPREIDGKQVGPERIKKAEIVVRPDVIFLDVSSRGRAIHDEEFGQGFRVSEDFASLTRGQLIADVAHVVVGGLRLLRGRGAFSLTVREAARDGSRFVPDRGLTHAILEEVRTVTSFATIQDYEVVYANPRNQAFAARDRAPIRHVLLGRAE